MSYGRTSELPPRRRFTPPSRPVHILVLCEVCEKWISEEDRHQCQLDPVYAAERRRLRREKHMEVFGTVLVNA